jgi:hypothetical protein
VDIFGYYIPDAAAFALGIAAMVIVVIAAAIILDDNTGLPVRCSLRSCRG